MWKKSGVKRLLKLMNLSTEQRKHLSLDEKTTLGTDIYSEDITDWNTSLYAGKEPPKIEEKKEAKKEKSEPEKKENKDYYKLIFDALGEMFEGNQNMADKKLVQLTSFVNEKGEKIKGTWDLEKMSRKQAEVVWHKLEKEIAILDEPINLEGEN